MNNIEFTYVNYNTHIDDYPSIGFVMLLMVSNINYSSNYIHIVLS